MWKRTQKSQRQPLLTLLEVLQEDQGRTDSCKLPSWQFSLCEPQLAKVSLFFVFSCGILDHQTILCLGPAASALCQEQPLCPPAPSTSPNPPHSRLSDSLGCFLRLLSASLCLYFHLCLFLCLYYSFCFSLFLFLCLHVSVCLSLHLSPTP